MKASEPEASVRIVPEKEKEMAALAACRYGKGEV